MDELPRKAPLPSGQKDPAPQSWQAVACTAPISVPYFPAGQGVHVKLAPSLYLPAGQVSSVTVGVGEGVPEGDMVLEGVLEGVGLMVPLAVGVPLTVPLVVLLELGLGDPPPLLARSKRRKTCLHWGMTNRPAQLPAISSWVPDWLYYLGVSHRTATGSGTEMFFSHFW